LRKWIILLPLGFLATLSYASESAAPNSAEYCGDCHREIEDGWKRSAHSQAVESRLFQDALKLGDSELGPQTRKFCLACHSPIAVRTGDLALIRKVSWEGITCDYCHSIQGVNMSGKNPVASVQFTGIKSGPWKDVQSPAHGTAFSPVLISSLVCASCHEFKNGQGYAVLTTYSEWKSSSYGQRSQDCQSCHMYRIAGDVVDPRVKRTDTPGINLHEIPGGHSLDQLNKAIHAQMSATHDGDQLQVTVEVSNRGAGHSVPTGSPLRRLILEIHAAPYDGQHFDEVREFRRRVADKNGKELESEDLVFVTAARTISDTRIGAGETKKDVFTFPVKHGVQTQVEADLYYYFSPLATTEEKRRIKFLRISRLVP
jgi:Cytochrome c554 and c-prime